MLKIKTLILPSEVHGIGLFAAEFIKEGTVTWEYDVLFDPSFSLEIIDALTGHNKEQFLKYGYVDYDLNKFILCSDDQRFINHSSTKFNIKSTPNRDIAIKDIKPGEELLCNYNDYEPGWFEKRNLEESNFFDL